jgi:hypothetical protein
MKYTKIIVPLLALVAVCFLYWPDRPSYIPQKLWGVWQTDHERYAGRYLDISEAIFTIGQGQQQLQVFFIHQVKMDIIGHRERYTLFYREHAKNQEPLQSFTFFFQKTQEGDRIQMSNQGDILWHRTADHRRTAAPPGRETP